MTGHAPVVALVRRAALPLSWFTRAGAPELADAMRRWDRDREHLAAAGPRLAGLIGTDLVPREELGPAERATALTARRLLHALPDPIPAAAADAVAETAALAERTGRPELGRRLHHAAVTLTDLAARHPELDDAVDAEHHRLLKLPWSMLAGDPVARLAVAEANAGVVADTAARLSAGEPWTGKRMRQRAELLWRLVVRGTTRATPRGWLAHTGLLETDPDAPPAPPPELTDDYAVEYADNRHEGTGLAELADPDALLAVAPLYRESGSDITFWVVDQREPKRLRELRLRRTEELRAVLRALAGGALPLDRVTGVLLPAAAGPEVRASQRAALRTFVEHLVGLGVVTVSLPRTAAVTGWSARLDGLPRPSAGCYVDVHRRADRSLSLASARRLAELVGLASRVLRVIDPGPVPVRGLTDLSDRPRPVLDLMAEDLDGPPRTCAHRHDWPLPDGTDGPYQRLHTWLDARLDAGPVDLDDAVLGPPPAPLTWPVDCVLRPVWQDGGPLAVLDHIQPTGTLDSRFADALAELHPRGCARQDWYRDFLRLVEAELGGRFVELLVPSLSDRAANAIRRPAYTSAWTGDPDAARYYRPADRPAVHLPLGELTIRLVRGRPVVEAGAERIWPVYHATRSMPPPWDVVGARLLAASPRVHRQHWRALRYSLTAWPDRESVPRFTVGGGQLVLTPAQWRLPVEQLWRPDASLPTAARTLARLRAARSLPRWVTVAADPHEEPRACDLDSLHAVRLLDRARRAGATRLLLAEMLPAPDTPGGPAHHSELVLRLPLEADPAELAARVRAENAVDRLVD